MRNNKRKSLKNNKNDNAIVTERLTWANRCSEQTPPAEQKPSERRHKVAGLILTLPVWGIQGCAVGSAHKPLIIPLTRRLLLGPDGRTDVSSSARTAERDEGVRACRRRALHAHSPQPATHGVTHPGGLKITWAHPEHDVRARRAHIPGTSW